MRSGASHTAHTCTPSWPAAQARTACSVLCLERPLPSPPQRHSCFIAPNALIAPLRCSCSCTCCLRPCNKHAAPVRQQSVCTVQRHCSTLTQAHSASRSITAYMRWSQTRDLTPYPLAPICAARSGEAARSSLPAATAACARVRELLLIEEASVSAHLTALSAATSEALRLHHYSLPATLAAIGPPFGAAHLNAARTAGYFGNCKTYIQHSELIQRTISTGHTPISLTGTAHVTVHALARAEAMTKYTSPRTALYTLSWSCRRHCSTT